ncbi:GspE/PulE family protein [Rhodoferax antarcticus]|uniref:Type II/IV secretion system family protein n=1 Tax=Rhodoferax antarcticus ANT.BR TaxID=1111071 RepID=A0A1Q8Y915_9BURK|nr:ATPase, T2SS/T4P/T4SS family [Rhodoferax antarcticus]OLP04474.1 type II/IV secretion system family protein [Rhodoferax antarcticus ANT.BR]
MHQVGVVKLNPIVARSVEQSGRFVSTGGHAEGKVIDTLNNIFELAVVDRISDIHFEFDDIDGMLVRGRMAGDLMFLEYSLPTELARIARTKICAKSKLNDQERLIPQDGRMMVYFGGRRVDIRVALIPTVGGYKIVCRLLDSNNSDIQIDELEMPFLIKEAMKRVAESPEGMVLLSGPTGSGKTTTLYAMLRYLNDESRHILTIENPVEYSIKEFTQIDVDGNMTFSMAMKSALRLDPDVIMVGELRDEESAAIGVKAGATGHMMLSTVHANSAPETLTRLMAMGLKSNSISAVMSAMIAQRLVKKIGADAEIEWIKPNDIERQWLQKRQMYSESQVFPKIVKGGFGGRVAMIEMIEMTQDMRYLMDMSETEPNWINKLVEMAVNQEQFETLAQAGVRLALEGKTTLREVMKAVGATGYVPTRRRFEQILIHQGLLSLESLEDSHREISESRHAGRVVTLEDYLVKMELCKLEDVTNAIKMAGNLVG